MNDGSAVWAFILANFIIAFFLWLVVFGICGAVAAWVGPPEDRVRWFLLTFFFLGPMGVGFAAIAPSGPRKREDAWQYTCECCGAVQNITHGTKTADCWQCGDQLF